MSIPLRWFEALEQSPVAAALAESALAYPLVEGLHLIGLAVSVGLLVLTDLRLLGLFLREVPADQVLHQLRPWTLGGFAVTFVSGLLLFIASATSLIDNPAFLLKLLFIVLAGINALYFEFRLARRPTAWVAAVRLPTAVRYAGAASLGLWTLVVITGRLIPYVQTGPAS
ncbi:MAG: hypothetical protein C0434_07205 [Xanthomonadaceae bacterium]|nr:hypothetical protein [Xanthomonadaceae bacterium]